MKLLLGSKEYLSAVNKDYYINIDLSNSNLIYQNENIIKIIDELNQFTIERNECKDYLLYGKIDTIRDKIVSDSYLLNSNNYNVSVGYVDRFEPLLNNSVNILNIQNDVVTVANDSFLINDIIMTSPDNKIRRVIDKTSPTTIILDNVSGLTTSSKLIPSVSRYERHYKDIIGVDFFKTYNSGFSINIFKDPIFQFHTFKNINIDNLSDNFNYPIRSLFFYFTSKNITSRRYKYNNSVIQSDNTKIDTIELNLNDLTYVVIDNVQDEFTDNGVVAYYKPFYEVPIKSMSNLVTDIKSSDYGNVPNYGFSFLNDDLVYREVLDLGLFENGVGMDYPYMNNLHYVYSDIKFSIRRKVPIAQYTSTAANDVYNDTLINENIGVQRLC